MQRSPQVHYSALGACLLAFALTTHVQAADSVSGSGKSAKSSGDSQLVRIFRDVINRGADLYNSGDQNGCYRLFQGALMTARPQLEKYPDLQKAIDNGLVEADRHFSIPERAFALRRVIDTIRTKIKSSGSGATRDVRSAESPLMKPAEARTTEKKPTEPKPDANKPPKPVASLWERLGGETNIRKVIDDFVDKASADSNVNFNRNGKVKLDPARVAHFKKEMLDFLSQETGGPYKYSGRSIKESHHVMGITNAEFNATVRHLKKALEENGAKPSEVVQVLKTVDSTRKDIVERKTGDTKHEPNTDERKPKPQKPGKPLKQTQP